MNEVRYLVLIEEQDRCSARPVRSADLRLARERIRSGDRQLFVLLRAGCATDADAAYDLTVDYDRDAALQRREEAVGQRDHRSPAILDNVFKGFRGLLKSTAVRALPIEMVAPAAKVPSDSLQRHQVAAVVDDGNDAAGRVVLLCVLN